MKKLTLKALELSASKVLSRKELKQIIGGDAGSGAVCLGCKTDSDCSSVLKGTCKYYYGNCNTYCCSGWQNC